jgi:NTP pyrophosphatase (non-canonical NTP hydrolase)
MFAIGYLSTLIININVNNMDFNTYQEKALTTAIFENKGQMGFIEFADDSNEGMVHFTSFIYPALGLCGETGEIAEKIKKIIRDNNAILDENSVNELKKELGDVLWYLAVLSANLGLELKDIAETNIEKLTSRKERETLSGSGDNR